MRAVAILVLLAVAGGGVHAHRRHVRDELLSRGSLREPFAPLSDRYDAPVRHHVRRLADHD